MPGSTEILVEGTPPRLMGLWFVALVLPISPLRLVETNPGEANSPSPLPRFFHWEPGGGRSWQDAAHPLVD